MLIRSICCKLTLAEATGFTKELLVYIEQVYVDGTGNINRLP